MSKSPAVDTAKEVANRESSEVIVVLAGGVRARVVPVSAQLIDEVTSAIPDPQVPVWHNPDKDRDEPNPNDPVYLKAMQDANRQRGIASADAMVMFGLELIDGLPEDDGWLAKLRFMAKHGKIKLTEYDLDDPIEREFLFKRFIGSTSEVFMRISEVSGITAADVERAERSFRS